MFATMLDKIYFEKQLYMYVYVYLYFYISIIIKTF